MDPRPFQFLDKKEKRVMTRKSILLTFALATLFALPAWGRGNCNDIPLQLIVEQ
jgi:hypothetical protein